MNFEINFLLKFYTKLVFHLQKYVNIIFLTKIC